MTKIEFALSLLLGATRRRLGVDDRPAPVPEPADPPRSRARREIEFVGYAQDCEIRGFVDLDAGRLTDSLNAHHDIRVADPMLIPLGADAGYLLHEVVVERDELVAVWARGPRGDVQRRQRTCPWPVEIHAGPYLIRGYLHAPPTVDALADLPRRGTMVPLTDAWIEFSAGARRTRSAAATLIVNRGLIERIKRAVEKEMELGESPTSHVTGGCLQGLHRAGPRPLTLLASLIVVNAQSAAPRQSPGTRTS